MKISVRNMAYVAMFASLLCVVAPVSFALGPVPITFATLMIYLAAGTLGWKYGTLAVGLYIMLGTLGLPVFTNFEGGFHKIAGVTGGYIIGYMPCALAIGITAGIFRKQQWTYIFGMVIGTLLLYTCGTIWFIVQTGNSLAISLTLCVTPFLIGDTIKIILAYIIAPKLRQALVHNYTRDYNKL